MFGTKREDVTRLQTAAWTGTPSMALNTKYFQPNQIKGVEMSWACGMYGEQKRRKEVSGEKTGEKEKCRWKPNIMVPT